MKLWTRLRGPPASLDELETPLNPGDDPFVRVVLDPWGGAYRLEYAGDSPRVRSPGPDGRLHTGDDAVYPSAAPED